MVGIENALEHDRDQLQGRIEESVREVRRAARRYRRISTALLLTGMLCGAVSTALAGDAFRGGSLAAKTAEATTGRVPAELARGWRNLCGIIAVLTPLLTIILAGLFSDTAKARLVFWRWRHPLPLRRSHPWTSYRTAAGRLRK